MSEDSRDVDVGRYAARVLEVKQQRDARIDDEMLREIARELGLSDADLQAVARIAADHLARGRGYREHGRLDDAIAEFEHACALQPRNLDAVFALANAVGARFTALRDARDKERAARLARECLDLDPQHAPSFALLNALEAKPQRRATLAAAVGALVVVVGAAGIAGVVFLKREPAPVATETPNPTTTQVTAQPTGPIDLPVTLVDDANSQGLRLETRGAVLSRYPDSAFFELRALLHNERHSEVREVNVRIDLVDVAGVVVATATEDAPADHEGALRTGDAAPLSHLVPTPKTATEALLTVTRVVDEPASSWPAAPEVTLHWPDDVRPPAGVSVVVTERHRAIDKALYGIGPFLKATWAFENRGTAPLSTLKVEVRTFNKAGEVLPRPKPALGDGKHWVTSSASDPVVRAGETRLMRVIDTVDPATDHVELWVVAAE